jgi:histidinol-phosphate aminotransferase
MSSGMSILHDSFGKFLDTIPKGVTVIVDQCYLEFAQDPDRLDASRYLTKGNVVVLRSLSKFYGLAALRLAYTLSDTTIASRLRHRALHPFLNSQMVEVAVTTLRDKSYHRTVKAFYDEEKQRIRTRLISAGFHVNKSDANFLLVDMKTVARFNSLYDKLRKSGIVCLQTQPHYGTYFMMTIEKRAINDRVLKIMIDG